MSYRTEAEDHDSPIEAALGSHKSCHCADRPCSCTSGDYLSKMAARIVDAILDAQQVLWKGEAEPVAKTLAVNTTIRILREYECNRVEFSVP